MNYGFLDLTQSHDRIFPLATLESQCRKFKEKYDEFLIRNATDPKNIECCLADLIIVACGIGRFGDMASFLCSIDVFSDCWNECKYKPSSLVLGEAVKKKMRMIEKRKWTYVGDGVYYMSSWRKNV